MGSVAWLKKTLEEARVPFRETRHAACFTSQEIAHAEHVSGHHVVKVVIALVDQRPVMLVLPASRNILMPRLQEVLAAKEVRLATENEIRELFPDVEVGAVPPFRHWKDKDIWMDTSMRQKGPILFQAGSHEESITVNFEDWFRLVSPRVEAFSCTGDFPPHHPRGEDIEAERWA